jgi:hypothetical protein
MAQAIPFPHTSVSIIEVHAPRSRIAPIYIPAGFLLLAGKRPDISSAKARLRRQRGFYVNFQVLVETTESSYTSWEELKHLVVMMPWIPQISHISMSFTVAHA